MLDHNNKLCVIFTILSFEFNSACLWNIFLIVLACVVSFEPSGELSQTVKSGVVEQQSCILDSNQLLHKLVFLGDIIQHHKFRELRSAAEVVVDNRGVLLHLLFQPLLNLFRFLWNKLSVGNDILH